MIVLKYIASSGNIYDLKSKDIGYAIDNNSTTGNAVLTINGGSVTASGSNYYDAVRLFANSLTKENSVTVTGGEVSSIWMQNPSDGAAGKNNLDVLGSVTVTGGEIGGLYLEPSAGFTAAISGGIVHTLGEFNVEADDADKIPTKFVSGG